MKDTFSSSQHVLQDTTFRIKPIKCNSRIQQVPGSVMYTDFLFSVLLSLFQMLVTERYGCTCSDTPEYKKQDFLKVAGQVCFTSVYFFNSLHPKDNYYSENNIYTHTLTVYMYIYTHTLKSFHHFQHKAGFGKSKKYPRIHHIRCHRAARTICPLKATEGGPIGEKSP